MCTQRSMQNAGDDSARSSFDSVAMRQAAEMPGGGGSSGGDIYSSGQSYQSYDAAELPVVDGVDDDAEIEPVVGGVDDDAEIEPNYRDRGIQSRSRSLEPQTWNMMMKLREKSSAVGQSLAAASSQDMAGLRAAVERDEVIQLDRSIELTKIVQNNENKSPLPLWVVNSVEALTKIKYSFKGSKWLMGLTVVIFVCGFIAYNYFSNSTPDASPEVLNCTPIMSFCGNIWAPGWQTCMEKQMKKTRGKIEEESRECVKRVWNLTEGNTTGANATGDNSSSV